MPVEEIVLTPTQGYQYEKKSLITSSSRTSVDLRVSWFEFSNPIPSYTSMSNMKLLFCLFYFRYQYMTTICIFFFNKSTSWWNPPTRVFYFSSWHAPKVSARHIYNIRKPSKALEQLLRASTKPVGIRWVPKAALDDWTKQDGFSPGLGWKPIQ